MSGAQCTTEWITSPPHPAMTYNLSFPVRAMLKRDLDGSGPLPESLWIGGSLTSVDGTAVGGVAWWDGSTWQRAATNIVSCWAMVELNGELIVSGSGVYRLAQGQWVVMGPNPVPSLVTAMVVHNGALYIAGTFTSASGVANTAGVARWNGTGWSALGTGLSAGAVVTGLVSTPTGLVVVGNFSTAGGQITQDSARWDGSFWHIMNGFPGGATWPTCLVSHAGALYAGHGANASGVVWKWNGATWVPVAGNSQLSGTINCLYSHSAKLVAAGQVLTINGVASGEYVADWDGVAWAKLPGPVRNWSMLGSDILTCVDYGGSLIFGGLTRATSAQNVLLSLFEWNEQDGWEIFSKGFSGTVRDIVALNGSVHVSGAFVFAGGKACNGVARFDGLEFHRLGNGLISNTNLNSSVRELCVWQGSLYAVLGSDSSQYLARWTGTSWTLTSMNVNGEVLCLSGSDRGLFASCTFGLHQFTGTLFWPVLHDGFSNFHMWHSETLYSATSNGVAKWLGATQWQYIPPGSTRVANVLATDGKLYALSLSSHGFGTFGVPSTYGSVGVFNGSSFVPLGRGFHFHGPDTAVTGGLTSYHGDIIAASSFYRVSPSGPFGSILRHDGLDWTAISPLVENAATPAFERIFTAAVIDDTIWFGGNFDRIANRPSGYLARFRSSPPPTFDSTPAPDTVRVGNTAHFTASTPTTGAVRLGWRRNGVPLVEGVALPGGGVPVDVATGNLFITGVGFADAGTIDCVVSTDCGSARTPAVSLVVHCHADLDSDGDPGAATPDGAVTIEDLLYCLAQF
jgi:hypothetical protein